MVMGRGVPNTWTSRRTSTEMTARAIEREHRYRHYLKLETPAFRCYDMSSIQPESGGRVVGVGRESTEHGYNTWNEEKLSGRTWGKVRRLGIE